MNTNTAVLRTTKPAAPRKGAGKPQQGASLLEGTRKPTRTNRGACQATAGKSKHTQTEPAAERFTVVEARIDVGMGNALFIRGEGDGLSWDKGQPLACMNASTWVWHSAQARDRIVFKLLVNDQLWAKGVDLVLEAGRKLEFVPAF
jgi:hypothetical protein